MALTNWVIDRQNSAASISVSSNGTTTLATVAIPTDRTVYIKAICFFATSSSGHLVDGACMQTECVVRNIGGTATLIAAISGSVNPQVSNTTNYIATRAEAADTTPTSLAGLTVTCATNAGNVRINAAQNSGTACDGFAFVEMYEAGYA